MDVGRIVRATPAGGQRRSRVDRLECAAARVEAQRSHGRIELVRHIDERQPRVKREMARPRAGAHDGVAAIYVTQRFRGEIELVDKDAVCAQIRGEREAVGRVGENAVRVRPALTAFDASRGALEPVDTRSTLPAGWSGTNYPADIHVAPSGNTAYVSRSEERRVG